MKNLIMTIAVALFTTFAASAQFMVVTTVNTPDSDLNEEWGTTNFTDNMGIGYMVNDKYVVGLVKAGEDARWRCFLRSMGTLPMECKHVCFCSSTNRRNDGQLNSWHWLFL